MRRLIPRNFPLTNNMKKSPHLHLSLIITACTFLFSCDSPKLKPPREDSNQENQQTTEGVGKIDREFARELAQEFGREFAIEFARQMKGSSNPVNLDFVKDINVTKSSEGLLSGGGKVHPLLAHCSEDVLEFYQKHPDCFSISSIDKGLRVFHTSTPVVGTSPVTTGIALKF